MQDIEVPTYGVDGHALYEEDTVSRKRVMLTVLLIVGCILAFLYIPQFFLPDQEDNIQGFPASTNQTAVRENSTVLRDAPSQDFDGDGIENAEESSLGTNPWDIDTDKDGVTDYCEVHVTSTDPCSAGQTLEDMQTKQDSQNGKSVGSPYKIGNTILWADNYTSKSYGSVVDTMTGYRFCGFDGYVHFSESDEGEIYAYKINNGVHQLLPYREKEQAWKVSSGDTVDLYDSKLDSIIQISFLDHSFFLPSNQVLDKIVSFLPEKGFLTFRLCTSADIEPDTSEDVTVEPTKPTYESGDYSRLAMNSNTLNDLLFVRQAIADSGSCVAASLYNDEAGEYIVIIYGYTARGELLVADAETLEPIGTIEIQEKSRKILNNDGAIVTNTYFDYKGFGFDSTNGDRINFFALSSPDGTSSPLRQPLGY